MMKRIPLILIGTLLTIATSLVNGLAGDDGIENAVPGQFPYHALLQIRVNENWCEGVIIDEQHILTAAKCVSQGNQEFVVPFRVMVQVGIIKTPSPLHVPAFIFIHPDYDPKSNQNNLAIIRMRIPLANNPNFPDQKISPIQRGDTNLPDGTTCVIVGFNKIVGVTANLKILKNVKILNRETCNRHHNNHVNDEHLCAGTESKAGVCQRNLGTPLVCNGNLVGILSFGFACGTLENTPGVYTQIKLYEAWIQEQIEQNDLTTTTTPAPKKEDDDDDSAVYKTGNFLLVITSVSLLLIRRY